MTILLLLYSSLLLTLGGIAMFFVLKITKIRSPVVLRFAWGGVLLLGIIWFHFPINVPIYETVEPPAVSNVDKPDDMKTEEKETVFVPPMDFETKNMFDIFTPENPHPEPQFQERRITNNEPKPIADVISKTEPTVETLVDSPNDTVVENSEKTPLPVPIKTETAKKETPGFTIGFPVSKFFLAIWLVGIFVLIMQRFLAGIKAYYCLKKCVPAQGDDAAIWERLLRERNIRCEKLQLLLSDDFGPGVIRLPRSYAVVVPKTFWEEASVAVREGILKHELSHYRHGDPAKSFFVHILKTLHWFNPVAHFAAARFDEAAEWRCDYEAFGESETADSDLAETLLAFRDTKPVTLWLGSTFSKLNVISRIRKLNEYREGKEDSGMKKFLIIALVLTVFALGLFRVQTNVVRIFAEEKTNINKTNENDLTPSQPWTAEQLDAANRTVDEFLTLIQKKDFVKAASLFSKELRRHCNEIKLQDRLTSLESNRVEEHDTNNNRTANQERSGSLKSFDTLEKSDHPGGPLWEATLRFENASARIRFALEPDGVKGTLISGFEMMPVPNEPSPKYIEMKYGAAELAKRLGFIHSLRVEFLDANGNKPEMRNGMNSGMTLFRLVNSLPENLTELNAMQTKYWTDPDDGTHWENFWPEKYYSEGAMVSARQNSVYYCNALPAGSYRVSFNNADFRKPEEIGHTGWTDPIPLDATQKHQSVKQTVVHGGILKLRAIDADTGEPLDEKSMGRVHISRLVCDRAPSQVSGGWTRYNLRNGVGTLFPGRYTLGVSGYISYPEDQVLTAAQEKYVAEIKNETETVVDVKIRRRPQTKEELDERWPFVISGTVKDEQGRQLPHTKIELWHHIGHRPFMSTTTAHENGHYTIRFSQHNWYSPREKPTPEKPSTERISIAASCPGFVWKGVRNSQGEIVPNEFLTKDERGVWSRNDKYFMTSYKPKPSGTHEAETSVYVSEPKTVDIVMQQGVRLRGEIPFEEPVPHPDPEDRWARPGVQLIFDLPRTETASWQPIFYESLKEIDGKWTFDVSALPYDTNAFLTFTSQVPVSWKDDIIVQRTDLFPLPKAGDYTLKLRWDTKTQDGVTLRQLQIDSLVDANGNVVDLGPVKSIIPVDYLLNRWTLQGTVRDDRGEPVPDAEVDFCRHNNWRVASLKKTTTDANGNYRVEIAASNRYPYNDKPHGPEKGELYILRVRKEGFVQKDFETEMTVFLSDSEKPEFDEFTYKAFTTKTIVPLRTAKTIDMHMNRNVKVEGFLTGDTGETLGGYTLNIQSDEKIDSDRRKDFGLSPGYFKTDENGKFTCDWIGSDQPFWFLLQGESSQADMLRTNNLFMVPGEQCQVELRLVTTDNSRHLILQNVRDTQGNDLTQKIVKDDIRAQPLLGSEETQKGQKIIDKLGDKIAPMFGITNNSVDTLDYVFYLRDTPRKFHVDSYTGESTSVLKGITFSTPLQEIVARPWNVSFRSLEESEGEIRLQTASSCRYGYGNGITESWAGYVSGGTEGILIVLDAETLLPKRVQSQRLKEEYSDWVSLGPKERGEFVPKRIRVETDSMAFDFRFKIHEGDVWLFDRSIRQDGNAEETVCRIDDVQIKLIQWAPEEKEKLVRDTLKKYEVANKYWLSWYPDDLPKFGYTFHQRDHDADVLSYEDIKSATNWFAEFQRKGISYIGVSRLLVIDIDALRCKRVVENQTEGTLEFDFVLKHEWMNAVGNGISGTWLGWFNGGVGKGTAILDTKTMTLREIRTASYDERYSDYVEIKPGQYVPRRIVIDMHNGDRSKSGQEGNLFFDFRFKVYEPCLWLFDRSVEMDADGKEKPDYPVWIDGVTVDGEQPVERP